MSPEPIAPRRRRPYATFLLLSALAACAAPPPAPLAVPAPSAPSARFANALSIQDLMLSVVDPAADALWDSVSTVSTAQGTEEHHPQSDDEWATLRQHAVRLAEAGNLLLIEGRPVSHAHAKLDDAHVAGVFDAAGVRGALERDRAGFADRAHGLYAAASQALAAIDARDAHRLLVAGDAIDKACEACHIVYWYPNARRPPAVSTAPVAPAEMTAPHSLALIAHYIHPSL